jgi:hypothetical protein
MRLKVLRSGAGCSANYNANPESSGGPLRPIATVVCGSGVQTPTGTRRGGKLHEPWGGSLPKPDSAESLRSTASGGIGLFLEK